MLETNTDGHQRVGSFKQAPSLEQSFKATRQRSLDICSFLELEDFVVQPSPEVSPPKWHLAHTTWFFEEMILVPYLNNYKRFNDKYNLLFNSYYKAMGTHWLQGSRGDLSRPTVAEVYRYREYIDTFLTELLFNIDHEKKKEVERLVTIGIHHEQQHQELLLMDIKYILAANPLSPKFTDIETQKFSKEKREWLSFTEGLYSVGNNESGFAYDNERPLHKVYLGDFEIQSDFITNEEYLEFIQAGGYENFSLWLSEGWNWVNDNNISMPLYWSKEGEEYIEFTFRGLEKIDLNQPVAHINFYEANAFAAWKGMRLPTEFEFEVYQSTKKIDENYDCMHRDHFLRRDHLWCWASSSYAPYPGFKSFDGALSEYNSKFMCNQYVLKGGCFATPPAHYRITYRNFYQAPQRWMFSGIKLVK